MYEIIFYDTADGKCPVQDFLDSLEPKFLAKTLRTIDLLETNGPLLRETLWTRTQKADHETGAADNK